jgi:hypothetical protein
MGLLDWVKRDSAMTRSQNDDRGSGWPRVNVYFYRADGRYPPASHAETPEQFAAMIPKIRNQVDNRLEVRITNGDDHLLFHATGKGVQWDGIGLSQHLDLARDARPEDDADTRQKPKDSWER